MEYFSATKKNTLESVLMRWMKLEPIIQSEIRQKYMAKGNLQYDLVKDLEIGRLYQVGQIIYKASFKRETVGQRGENMLPCWL